MVAVRGDPATVLRSVLLLCSIQSLPCGGGRLPSHCIQYHGRLSPCVTVVSLPRFSPGRTAQHRQIDDVSLSTLDTLVRQWGPSVARPNGLVVRCGACKVTTKVIAFNGIMLAVTGLTKLGYYSVPVLVIWRIRQFDTTGIAPGSGARYGLGRARVFWGASGGTW